MATFTGFPPEALKFLRALKRNNNREWFLANKATYDQKVKAPMATLVLELGRRIEPLAPEFSFDPARAIFRIYRDVRFSKDKSPYKTHIAAVSRPRGLNMHGGSGLYFHVSPDEVEIAGGLYHPEPAVLLAVRRHIADRHRKLRAILESREFRRAFGELWGEKLTRTPKGFASDHPAADLLRYKDLVADSTHPAELAESRELLPTLVRLYRVMLPLVRFLNEPLRRREGSPQP
jgi:uncharacterized protein (TIGR02453 family)